MSENENESNIPVEKAGEIKSGPSAPRVNLPAGFAPLSSRPAGVPIPPFPVKKAIAEVEVKPEEEIDLDASAEEAGQGFDDKPLLAQYPVRKPKVEVVRLDPALVYATNESLEELDDQMEGFTGESEVIEIKEDDLEDVLDSLESPEDSEGDFVDEDPEEEEEPAEEESAEEESAEEESAEEESAEEESAEEESAEEDDPIQDALEELSDLEDLDEEEEASGDSLLDDLPKEDFEDLPSGVDDADESGPEDPKPSQKVPAPEEVSDFVPPHKTKSEEMEVLERTTERLEMIATSDEKASKWAFWKRPSKRDQQLSRISEGYLEMVELVRAIRGQLESQNENNVILRESLVHLPEAVKGLDRFSKSQQTVGKALEEIHGQMKRYSDKDERLAQSMDGFNNTLKGMDDTGKATMRTFDRVQERMRDSDIRMENLFQNVQNTEEKVGETMVRLQRNMALMQMVFLGCLMIVIGVLVFTVIVKKDDAKPEPRQEEVSGKSSTSAEE